LAFLQNNDNFRPVLNTTSYEALTNYEHMLIIKESITDEEETNPNPRPECNNVFGERHTMFIKWG
jgi:hypothetical protein